MISFSLSLRHKVLFFPVLFQTSFIKLFETLQALSHFHEKSLYRAKVSHPPKAEILLLPLLESLKASLPIFSDHQTHLSVLQSFDLDLYPQLLTISTCCVNFRLGLQWLPGLLQVWSFNVICFFECWVEAVQ